MRDFRNKQKKTFKGIINKRKSINYQIDTCRSRLEFVAFIQQSGHVINVVVINADEAVL